MDLRETQLNDPKDKELTFYEAVHLTKEALNTPDITIIELRMHPDGLWTVLYFLN